LVVDPAGWPLAGRERELRAIEARLDPGSRGVRPPQAGVLLLGAAGVGKTRLVREVLARWTAGGGESEWVVGPHLPERIADEPAARSGRGPVVLGIDDVHLLDDRSVALVGRLARRGLVAPVASARDDEPLSDVVLARWPDPASRRTVPGLAPEAVDQILGHALPGQIDPVTRQRLHRLAGGNPLLLREVLADAAETGGLARREGVWCWRGAVPATARLAELVTAQLATLSPGALSVLEMLACGEPLPLPLVARVAEPAAIEEARRSGRVVADRSGGRVALRFAHPLYAEVLRANLPASRVRRISGVLAEAQAAEPVRRREDALLAAVWQLQSGHLREPKLLLLAAREASGRFDVELAERLARAARGPAGGWEADWLLARILLFTGRAEQAAEVLPGPPPTRGELLARWAVTRADLSYWGLGKPDEALRALDAVAPDEPGGELTESSRAWILLFDGRCRDALATVSALLGRLAQAPPAQWACAGGAMAAGLLGRIGQAQAMWERGRAAAAAAEGSPSGQVHIGYGSCLALRLAGHLREAAAVAEEGYRAAVAGDAGPMVGYWAALRGIVRKAQGYAAGAQAALREALVLLGEYDTYRLRRVCLAELAGAYALGGDLANARDCLARADRLDDGTNRLFDAWVELDRAWVQVAEGELSTSVDTAVRAAKLAQESDQPAFEAICRYDAVRIGGAAPVGERLREVAGGVEGRVAGLLVAVADGLGAGGGLGAGSGRGLEQAAAALADEGQVLLAAEAAAGAARAYQQAGRAASMRRALRLAAELTGQCQGARTPLLRLAGRVGLLSPREREVAVLATSQPSRQIADRLGLSLNTVNNTLSRAFVKLGASNRAELAAILRDDPLG
jgi:DNA-binding CsgD family transcriptional regulator